MAGLRQLARIDRGEHARSSSDRVTLSPPHLVTLILAVLFFGPLIAPLFQATQLPLLADSGALAHDLLARYICPTPAKSYVLLGFPMAVCARCWGATIGLWAAWLFIRRTTNDERPTLGFMHSSLVIRRWSFVPQCLSGYFALIWPARWLVAVLPLLLWLAEIRLWTAAPYGVLLLNGAFAGFWAGLLFCSIRPPRFGGL